MLCFFKLASAFKAYQNAMRSGDAIVMEVLESEFCGVFLLLDKNNYVDIILSQMERKYSNCSYKQLHEIRINSVSRYLKNDPEKKTIYPLHVLDEMMENVNMWIKGLPLGDDKDLWLLHSPNVTLARKCLLFDHNEYKHGHFDFEKYVNDGVAEERHCKENFYDKENLPT